MALLGVYLCSSYACEELVEYEGETCLLCAFDNLDNK